MLISDAIELIRGAIAKRGGTWADLGAGDGTFTRALIELLGPTARIYAVDRDAKALADLEAWAAKQVVEVLPVVADITRPFELPGLDGRLLDGVLLANTLHFVPESKQVLARLATLVRPGGRIVLVEYDQSQATRWVPYPLPSAQLPELARAAGLSIPILTASRPSAFGGTLYTAAADRLA